MIPLILLVACVKHPAAPPLEELPPAAPPSPPSGVVADAVYVDGDLPLEVPVPPGWTAHPGRRDTPLRLSLTEDGPGARVDILALPRGATAPLSRADCSWEFVDTGRYRGLLVAEEVTVATCTPVDPAGTHVFATLLTREDVTWSLEIVTRGDAMVRDKAVGEALLRGVRFERPVAIPVL